MLRSVFMGTPSFAIPSFETTLQRTDLRLVVTQPDRPSGRGRKLTPPPIKVMALEQGIEVAQPEGSVTRELGARLEELKPDVIVVAAFGKFLGRKILNLPRLGCLNVHASILPRHRGASPIVWAIKAGDAETGVTIQQMVPGMDEGDVLVTRRTPIAPDETAGEVTDRLCELGAEALIEALERAEAGTFDPTPQDHDLATLAPPLCKEDGEIDWTMSAVQVHDHVRAMNPWPVASSSCHSSRLLLHRSRVISSEGEQGRPGEVIKADKQGVYIACGQGVIEMLEGQREGRKRLCSKEMVCGRLVEPCLLLGQAVR
jgi:methionyl-tRNA formyltransferase